MDTARLGLTSEQPKCQCAAAFTLPRPPHSPGRMRCPRGGDTVAYTWFALDFMAGVFVDVHLCPSSVVNLNTIMVFLF